MPETVLPQDGSVGAFYDVMSDLQYYWVVLFFRAYFFDGIA